MHQGALSPRARQQSGLAASGKPASSLHTPLLSERVPVRALPAASLLASSGKLLQLCCFALRKLGCFPSYVIPQT